MVPTRLLEALDLEATAFKDLPGGSVIEKQRMQVIGFVMLIKTQEYEAIHLGILADVADCLLEIETMIECVDGDHEIGSVVQFGNVLLSRHRVDFRRLI
jgi:hypothetical protein